MIHKRLRVYDWKNRLVSWSQNRCKSCGQFLSKKQTMYCEKCGYTNQLRINRKSSKKKYHTNEDYRKKEIKRVVESRRKSKVFTE